MLALFLLEVHCARKNVEKCNTHIKTVKNTYIKTVKKGLLAQISQKVRTVLVTVKRGLWASIPSGCFCFASVLC